MKQIGKIGEYHAVVIGQPDGTAAYTIYDKHGHTVVTGTRAGTEKQVGQYLKRTTLKRYNTRGGDNMASDYFNTASKLTDAEEATNAIA